MIEIRRSDERYHHETDWLSTYWSFSFDHYDDPRYVSFGPLRVFNDDMIRPGRGFDMHPHRDMEIITYVLSGAVAHKDNAGHAGVVRAGEVQVMSAGTGVVHSEHNASATDLLHLLQIWIVPERTGLPPRYEQKRFTTEERRGVLLPVASGRRLAGALRIFQDATLYVSHLPPGTDLTYDLEPGRRAYLFVVDGALCRSGETLRSGDAAAISGETRLVFAAATASEIVLLDLP